MTSVFRRRRLRDRSLAAALAVVVAVIGFVVYQSSDIRNATLATGTPGNAPAGAFAAGSETAVSGRIPTTLTQKWSAPTNPVTGAVVSASGVVVTTSAHAVTAHDAVSGVVRWTYTRSNRTLCAVGSGDIGPANMASSVSVAGLATVFDENGFCSQVATFDPVTGARGKVRTSPNEEHGSLAFGASYAGWLGPNRVEVWRFDLVRTIQYGVQIDPPKAGYSRLGCTFTDLALGNNQFGTVEHCPAEGKNARVVLNFDDPGSVSGRPNGSDNFQHTIRADIDTGAPAARIVGISADRVAVLVSAPTPAVVVYDASGKQTSRTPVDIPAADIVAADSVADPAQVTPALQTADHRYSLIGHHLISISMTTIQAVPPDTAFPTTPAVTTTSASIAGALSPPPATASVIDIQVNWVAAGALGLPAVIGTTVLLPTANGLTPFSASVGPTATDGPSPIRVDRGGYTGRVDASAVGDMIIEDRGATVVALG